MYNIKIAGEYYEDSTTHNKWHIELLRDLYETMNPKRAAEKAASTLKGCTGCTNCTYCTDCTNCDDCFYCSDCTNCKDCSHCSGCNNCCYCGYCKKCTDCSDCAYCIECTSNVCCGGCINCTGIHTDFLAQGVVSFDYVLTPKRPDNIDQHLLFSLGMEKRPTAEKLIQEYSLPTCYGFAHAVLQVAEAHAEKYASYRVREVYKLVYAEGRDGDQCKK